MDKINCVIEVNTINEAFIGKFCPYCGIHPSKLIEHIASCEMAKPNLEAAEIFERESYRYAFHKECGDVMILKIDRGLALVENSNGRYSVPVVSLKCGGLADVIETINKCKLSENQIKSLIEHLMHGIGIYDMNQLSNKLQEELKIGSRVEITLNGEAKTGTIKKKYSSNQYIIDIDDGPTVNVVSEKIKNITKMEWRYNN